MKKNTNKLWAAAWALLSLFYMATAAFNFWEQRLAAGIIMMIAGWALCVVNCWFYGELEGVDLAWDEVMEKLDYAEEIVAEAEEYRKRLMQGCEHGCRENKHNEV